jgi:hypothetical protein
MSAKSVLQAAVAAFVYPMVKAMADALRVHIDGPAHQLATSSVAGLLQSQTPAVVEAGFYSKAVPLAIVDGEVTPDLDLGTVFTVAVDQPFTLNAPLHLENKAGMFSIVATQDETGTHAMVTDEIYHLASGAWTLTANTVNLMWITLDGSGTALDAVIAQRGT